MSTSASVSSMMRQGPSSTGLTAPSLQIHRPRQYSQGFFEPSLGSAGSGSTSGSGSASGHVGAGGGSNSIATAMSGTTATSRTRTPTPTSATSPKNVTASQAAAQAAMHVQLQQQQQQQQHHPSLQSARQRSQTIPFHELQAGGQAATGTKSGGQPLSPTFATGGLGSIGGGATGGADVGSVGASPYNNGIVGGHRVAAASAATAAYPKSALGLGSVSSAAGTSLAERGASPTFDGMDLKPAKEKSKKKLFSKPKTISISRDKDADKKLPPHPSPNKTTTHGIPGSARALNSSTLSLVDSVTSGANSIYTMASNASTSTLVPAERIPTNEKERDKEKKHHFLSRQKHKLRDKDDHHHLPLSSANSTSKPTDPNDPQPLYSFAVPVSPGHTSTFTKSVSGLDLRHGGRALRERKREERAGSSALAALPSNSSFLVDPVRERELSISQDSKGDWSSIVTVTPQQTQQQSQLQQQQGGLAGSISGPTSSQVPEQLSPAVLASLGQTFGLPGLQPDDAWPLLKARLLLVFEGEDPRPPLEDFNGLISVHIRRCIQRRAPDLLLEDFCDLLHTGFVSLDHALQPVPDERLVPHLVELWLVVYGTIFPFLQAVFLPLDLEFKGRGPLMSAREAAEFWEGVRPEHAGMVSAGNISENKDTNSNNNNENLLDVRRLALTAFRDCVILPRYDTLMAIFSRLSLENVLGGGIGSSITGTTPDWQHQSQATLHNHGNINNSGQPIVEPALASYSSQTSTLLDSATSLGARSRATSNTSACSFHSVHSQPQQTQQLPPIPALPTVSAGTGTGAGTSALASSYSSNSSPFLSLRNQNTANTSYPQPTSNAAPIFSSSSANLPIDSTHITNIIGRMLQCVSVLASVHDNNYTNNASASASVSVSVSANTNPHVSTTTDKNNTNSSTSNNMDISRNDTNATEAHQDDRQAKMERLAKELKHNWLGRGRTGRQRRGIIGGRGRVGSLGIEGSIVNGGVDGVGGVGGVSGEVSRPHAAGAASGISSSSVGNIGLSTGGVGAATGLGIGSLHSNINDSSVNSNNVAGVAAVKVGPGLGPGTATATATAASTVGGWL